MEPQPEPLEYYLIVTAALLAVAFLTLRSLSRNPLIRKRLGLGAYLLLAVVVFRTVDLYFEELPISLGDE